MIEMIKLKKHRSTLNMSNSRRKARGRIRKPSQPRKGIEKHHLVCIARDKVMTRRPLLEDTFGVETKEIQHKGKEEDSGNNAARPWIKFRQ